jgi:archaellum component FlaF (FlaF/FlaG flagellin family)
VTDAVIPVQNPAVTDSSLDAEQLTVSSVVVKRERMQLAGKNAADIAEVKNATPAATDYGAVVRLLRPPVSATVLASASRTTTQTQADQSNPGFRGIAVTLDMTIVGTGSVTLEIDVKDPVSGKYIPLLTGAAVTTNSTNVYKVYPGATAAANVTANDNLWDTYRIKVVANNANAATYSVTSTLLP